MPETFGIELAGEYIRVDRDTLTTLRDKLDVVIESAEPYVEYQGVCIPANETVRQQLAELIGTELPDKPPPETDSGEPRKTASPIVVKAKENFVCKNWPLCISPRPVFIAKETPPSIKTALFPYQQCSLKWQIDAWQAGFPGVLNADDQGLGKTLQTLAFLRWLQNNLDAVNKEKRLPILIVAPTGLLRTWEEEVEAHLAGDQLGERLRVYGSALRQLRTKTAGKDIDDGKPRLNFASLKDAIGNGNGHRQWLLTTYETLANYQHSFREINFSTVVFDETQKIKNPKTLVSLAARSVKADFRIGLTGTPIENHVTDLWAIMDAIAPGYICTLKEYAECYQNVTAERMSELHACIFKPLRNGDWKCPAPGIRRLKEDLKEDQIKTLPHKNYRVYPREMPKAQALAYEKARHHLSGDGAKRGDTLKLLHHIRSVSLHPQSPETMQADPESYLCHSARLIGVTAYS